VVDALPLVRLAQFDVQLAPFVPGRVDVDRAVAVKGDVNTVPKLILEPVVVGSGCRIPAFPEQAKMAV